MRLALVLLAATLATAPATARPRPGPTLLPQGFARGGLAARAGGIRLDRKVKAEMQWNNPPRTDVPVLRGGKLRSLLPPSPTPVPRRRPASKRRH